MHDEWLKQEMKAAEKRIFNGSARFISDDTAKQTMKDRIDEIKRRQKQSSAG